MKRLLVCLVFTFLFTGSAFGEHYKIRDDAQGGDCLARKIGTWDPASKTCTLTASRVASISIEDDGITLDGRGLMLRRGPGSRIEGVTIQGRKNVVIRRLRVIGFHLGILIGRGHSVTVEDCYVSGPSTTVTGIFLDHTHGNRVTKNLILSCMGNGITLQDSNRNHAIKNTILLNPGGSIWMWDSHDNLVAENRLRGTGGVGCPGIMARSSNRNEFTDNHLSRHSPYGFEFNGSDANRVVFNRVINNKKDGFLLWGGNHNLVYCNDFQGHALGIELIGQALGNQIWWNNFYLNDTANDLVGGGLNVFHHPRPEGGNFWKPHAPNCADANGDGFCDAPFVFRGNQDPLPWVQPIPWRANPAICMRPPEPPICEQQQAPAQLVLDVVVVVEGVITEGMSDAFIKATSTDVSLITYNKIYEGREGVSKGLGEIVRCGKDKPEVFRQHDVLQPSPDVAELLISGCGETEIEFLVITGVDPENKTRKIEMIALMDQ